MVTQEQVRFFGDNGYCLVEGLFSTLEADELRREAHDLAARLSAKTNMDATWASARAAVAEAAQTQILHCHNVQFYSAAFTRMICDPRFTDAAAGFIGSPNVQLHHTKMFIKPPEKGSPFPMHQDEPFFPHPKKHSMIAAIVHFDDAPLEKGCLRVVPRSHKLGPLPHLGEGSWHLPFEEYPIESATPLPAKAGDVLFFSYLTIHGSGINTSNEARTTVLVQMRDPEDVPDENSHASRGQGMMLRGFDPVAEPRGVS